MTALTTQQRQLWKFLKSQSVGVMATVGADGEPHAATLYYTTDKPFRIAFITKTGTKKHDNIRHNDHAVFVIHEPDTQTAVQIIGIVAKVKDVSKARQVFSDILNISAETSKSKVPPISKLLAGDYVTYELEPRQIRMASFADSKARAHTYKEMFQTFDFPPSSN